MHFWDTSTQKLLPGIMRGFGDYKSLTAGFEQVMNCDQDLFRKFFHAMLDEGIYLAPSAFEAGFVSAAHTEQDLQQTVEVAEVVFKKTK